MSLSSMRHRDLVRIFLNEKDFVNSLYCAEKLGVSDRTVKSDIAIINETLKDLNCQIISKRGKGYRLRCDNQDVIYEALKKEESKHGFRNERLYNIIILLLSTNKEISLAYIEDTLYISRSTIENDLKRLKMLLKNFYPSIKLVRKNETIALLADEFTLRLFLNRILVSKWNNTIQMLDILGGGIDENQFEKLKDISISIMNSNKIDLPDKSIADIFAYLMIAKSRIKLSKEIKNIDNNNYYLINKESFILSNLANELFYNVIDTEDICINKDLEINKLAIKLSFMNIHLPMKLNKSDVVKNMPKDVIDIVEKILGDIDTDYNLRLRYDDDLFIGLAFHIKALINRKKYYPDIIDASPVTSEMKKNYPYIFELSLNINKVFSDVVGINLNENDLSNMAARIEASIERNKPSYENKRIKVAIISNLNLSYIDLLCANLKNTFYPQIEIVGIYHVYNIHLALDNKPEVIIHTFNIKKDMFPGNIKMVKVDYILSQSDKLNILNTLELVKESSVDNKYDIIKNFDEELFFKDLNLKSKEEIISLLTNMFIMKGYVSNDFLEKVLEKERLSGTVINKNTAVLNTIESCSKESKIGVMILSDNVIWDDYNIKLVFILALTKEDQKDLGYILSIISDLAEDKYIFEKLFSVKTFNDFIDIIYDIQRNK